MQFVPLTVPLKLQQGSLFNFTALTVYVYLIKSPHDYSLVIHNHLGFHGYARSPKPYYSIIYSSSRLTGRDFRYTIQHSTPYGDRTHRHMPLSVDHMLSFGCEVLGFAVAVHVCVCTFSMLCWCWWSLSRISGNGHFNEFLNRGLQAPKWKLSSLLRHHDRLLWPLL